MLENKKKKKKQTRLKQVKATRWEEQREVVACCVHEEKENQSWIYLLGFWVRSVRTEVRKGWNERMWNSRSAHSVTPVAYATSLLPPSCTKLYTNPLSLSPLLYYTPLPSHLHFTLWLSLTSAHSPIYALSFNNFFSLFIIVNLSLYLFLLKITLLYATLR